MLEEQRTQDISETRPWLTQIFSSQDTEALRANYDSWADTYDADLKEDWSFMPVAIAQTLSQLAPHKDISILDAGAGTGLVGQALNREGFTHLTAVDLSEKMLAIAKNRKVYKHLHQKNLDHSPLFSEPLEFEAIVAAGVFAYAHAGKTALNNLYSSLHKKGYFLLTIREDYRDQMQSALDNLSWHLIDEKEFPIYDALKQMYLLTFRKTS